MQAHIATRYGFNRRWLIHIPGHTWHEYWACYLCAFFLFLENVPTIGHILKKKGERCVTERGGLAPAMGVIFPSELDCQCSRSCQLPWVNQGRWQRWHLATGRAQMEIFTPGLQFFVFTVNVLYFVGRNVQSGAFPRSFQCLGAWFSTLKRHQPLVLSYGNISCIYLAFF